MLTLTGARGGHTDVLVIDCLRPALDALGLSEDKDAGRWLDAPDENQADRRSAHLALTRAESMGRDSFFAWRRAQHEALRPRPFARR